MVPSRGCDKSPTSPRPFAPPPSSPGPPGPSQGTFTLSGTIYEYGVPLPDVTIKVASSTETGLTTVSALDGSFALDGIRGSIGIELTKAGYQRAAQQLTVNTHVTLVFGMIAAESRGTPYTGTYSLSLFTSEQCPANFPEAARRRVYTANMTQDGGRLVVKLTGADFIVNNGEGDRFNGGVEASGMIFLPISRGPWDYGDTYNVVERFADTALTVTGWAQVLGTPDFISGPLEGAISIAGGPSPPFWPFRSQCSIARFEMARRQ